MEGLQYSNSLMYRVPFEWIVELSNVRDQNTHRLEKVHQPNGRNTAFVLKEGNGVTVFESL